MLFENFNINKNILRALDEKGYINPTPIQQQSIPILLEGKDILGCAQTGTGKTAAFAIPILQNLYNEKFNTKTPKKIKALILAPTRELAIQIDESFTEYGKYLNFKNTVIFGGVTKMHQINALRAGVDILVATPGRLLDLMNQNYIKLNDINYFVLDEADRMLDMGFIHDVKKIISKLPKERQTLLFSATMPKEISQLVDSILVNPEKVAVAPVSSTVDTVDQCMYYVDKKNKKFLLNDILKDKSIVSALVFSRTKRGANKITADLEKAGINAQAIHGNKSQSARQKALNDFKSGKTRVLVATDIAARGIDVDELSHVINFDMPNPPETYVHRIGRTGRAGNNGIAITFCDHEEKDFLKDIEKLIDKSIPLIENHAYPMGDAPIVTADVSKNRKSSKKPNSNPYAKMRRKKNNNNIKKQSQKK
ncbi:DEAD/DEAH box helicase [Clostridium grantii]|uniref:ATP-dependent RNA helicase CshA n=1 Tax=Clostridium grantii DSM 8605 TaxID=1121316 RepID=A0A1M5T709_9CLOT|nr:DEAD/DEAH box helicase [Clostridium grantii]SHH46547.1 ATP-dependent RNA helicase RhlE [Clostridium grantii DSM 8605]